MEERSSLLPAQLLLSHIQVACGIRFSNFTIITNDQPLMRRCTFAGRPNASSLCHLEADALGVLWGKHNEDTLKPMAKLLGPNMPPGCRTSYPNGEPVAGLRPQACQHVLVEKPAGPAQAQQQVKGSSRRQQGCRGTAGRG